MRIVGNDPTLSRQLTATASGVISAAGKSLVVNTDGTVSVVSNSPDVLGSETTVYSGDFQAANAVYDEGQDKILFMYRGASNYGYAVVGTVSGNSISFGTPTAFISSGASYFSSTYDPDNAKTAIFFNDNGDSNKQKAVVATISGTSVSFGTVAIFSSENTSVPTKDSTYDTSQDKIIVVFSKGTSPNPVTVEAVAATISGTSISFGSELELDNSTSAEIGVAYDENAAKSLMIYRKASTGKVESRVLSLSGSTVSSGTETNLYNGVGDKIGITYDSTAQKLVAFYRHDSGTTHTKFIVATISGTSVSYGTPVDTGIDFNGTPRNNSIHHNVAANKIVFIGRDGGNSYIIKYIIATVSGTSISIDNTVTVYGESNDSYLSCNVYDPDQEKSVLFYADGTAGAFKNPIARVLAVGSGENLTTENFIGTSAHSATDGAKVLVNTQGAIDENQSGLTAGQTFFVDVNGALRLSTTISESLGSETVFETGTVGEAGEGTFATFDSSNNRVIIFYQDVNNSSYGTACVGSVSGTTITFGTPTVIQSANLLAFGATFDSNNNKVVVVYTNQSSSEISQASVGTVDPSDNSISFGTAATYDSSNGTSNNAAAFDTSNNKVAILYRDLYSGGGHGKSRVGTVSGTDITFGTEVTFESADSQFIESVFDTSNNKVVVAYKDDGNSGYGTAIVGTISGTDISFGTAAVFESANVSDISIAFDNSNNKVIIAYRDIGNSGHGTAIVGTVSGTSISFGSAAVFEAAGTYDISITFDSNVNKAVIAYYDDDDSDYGKYIIGTVSGTSISYGTATTFNAGTTAYISTTFDSNENKAVIFFRDSGDSNKGKGIVLQNSEDLSGSLSTDAVTAGTALSATKLLVKG